MNVVLIENSEHKVDRDQRRQDQVGLRGEGGLKRLRRALKARMNRSWDDHGMFHILNRNYCVPEGNTGLEIEGEGDRRKLSLVGDGERGHRRLIVREGAEWNLLPRGRTDIDILERVGALLELLGH